MPTRALLALAAALPVVLSTGVAAAHFTLVTPAPADNSVTGGKGAPPCGPVPPVVPYPPTEAQGGHEIDLTLNETRYHPGFYRVALALNDRSELPPDNVVYDVNGMILPPNGDPAGASARADFEVDPKFPVLADNLFAHTAKTDGMFSAKILLPNVNCDRCTLQVIQFMAKHGWGDPGGYFYHHCAELKITADPSLPLFDPNEMSGSGGAGGSSGAAGVAEPSTGGDTGNGTGGSPAATGGAPDEPSGTGASGGESAAAGDGSATPTNSGADEQDDGGCGIAKRHQGGATALAALGLLIALVRRRRAS